MIRPSSENRSLSDGTPWPHPFGATKMPELPPSAPRRGSALSRFVGATVMRLLGWRLVGRYPDVPKLIIAGGPHTSNWDGIIGFAAILRLNLDVRIMVKESLFRGLAGVLLRRLRALAVDRSRPGGITGQMVERFGTEEKLVLGVTPEGTRKKVEAWKTGWYRIAEGADVPILPITLDYGRKEIRLGPTFFPSGDMEADFQSMRALLATATPRNPQRA